MIVLAPGLPQPLAADPLVGALLVAVGAGEVELADLDLRQDHAALVGGLGIGTRQVDLDGRAGGQIVEVDRQIDVVARLHRRVGTGRGLGMARDELLGAQHLRKTRLPLGHLGCPALERCLRIGVAGDAGLAVRARPLEERRADFDTIHRRIDERIGGVAILDRRRALFGIVERVGELGHWSVRPAVPISDRSGPTLPGTSRVLGPMMWQARQPPPRVRSKASF